MQNGTATGPIAGWVIALLGARTLIGKPRGDNELVQELDPVFELQIAQTPKGMMHVAAPVMMLASVQNLIIDMLTPMIHIDTLNAMERKSLEQAVRIADEMRNNLRASQIGLVMAGPGAKLPPIRGM